MVNATSPNETAVKIPIAYYQDVTFEIGDAVMLVYKSETK